MKMWKWWMIEMCNIERYVINSNLWWHLYGKHTKDYKDELAASSKRIHDRFAEIRENIAAAKTAMIWKYIVTPLGDYEYAYARTLDDMYTPEDIAASKHIKKIRLKIIKERKKTIINRIMDIIWYYK